MAIVSVLNNLAEIGCKRIDNKQLDIHVSGHAHSEECKLLTSLLNPKYFAPIHGELFMRHAHRDMMVRDLQLKKENTFIMKNGQGVVLSPKGARVMTDDEAICGPDVLVQLGEVVHDDVLEQRQFLSENGIMIICAHVEKGRLKRLEIRSKGFLYMDMEHDIIKTLTKEIEELWVRTYDPSRPDDALESPIKNHVEKFFLRKFRKEQVVEVIIN